MATTQNPRSAQCNGARIALDVIRPIIRGLAAMSVAPEPLVPDSEAMAVQDFAAALEDIAAHAGMPHLALPIARRLPLGARGTADYRFCTSATLLDALGNGGAHVALLPTALRHELVIEHDRARLVARHVGRPHRILTELAVAFVVQRLRDVVGEAAVALAEVRFAHALSGPVEPYAQFFGTRVTFAARVDDIAFERDLVRAPLLTANPVVAAMLAAHPGARADADAGEIVARVRAVVDQALRRHRDVPTVEDVAQRLALSSRSLQRRLGAAGAPYSTVIDHARRDHALALLAREDALLEQVAEHLGFQSVAAFFRAFRRWTGVSPRAFQRARGALGKQVGAPSKSRDVTSVRGGIR